MDRRTVETSLFFNVNFYSEVSLNIGGEMAFYVLAGSKNCPFDWHS